MSLLELSVCGSRVPSLRKAPTGPVDYGVAVAVLDWLDSVGLFLFPWQRDVVRDGLSMRGQKWAAYEVDLVLSRQNGKNEILVAIELAAVAVLNMRLVVHSAHEAVTSAKHFARFQQLAEELPEFRRLLPATKTLGFYTSNGKEHIQFRNGATIDFRTRTGKAGRGFTADLVVLDEAFDLPAKAVGSLMYTIRARRNAQIWKTSSAAHVDSIVLHNDRRRALADDPDDSRFLYLEWGNDPGCDPADEQTWLRSNPSIGMQAPAFELDLQTFRNEYASARHDPELLAEFVREVCGVPESAELGGWAIPAEIWTGLVDRDSVVASNDQWALAVSPDRKWASFGIAGRTREGRVHVECIDRRALYGDDWILPRALEVYAAKRLPLRIAKGAAEDAYTSRLREAGVTVEEVSGSDAARATGQMIDLANSGMLVHRDQPWLNKALAAAEKRTAPDGAVRWNPLKSSADISALMSVTVAVGGVPCEVRPPRIWSLAPKG